MQSQNEVVMVTELIIVWVIGVVSFFLLWALLAKVVKWMSNRKSQDKEDLQQKSSEKENSPKQES